MLQCYLLWTMVSIRRLLQLILCIGVSTSPQKHHSFFFAKVSSLNLQTIQVPLFRRFTTLPPPKKERFVFHAPSYKLDFSVNSHLLKVTKFLVEISQFKFLVMTEKKIFIKSFFAIKYFRF